MSVSIADAILEAAQILRQGGVPEARREAGSLLANVIDQDLTYIIGHPQQHLEPEAAKRFQNYVRRRASGEPLQYITGHQQFYGLDFEVTNDVLIPRPETEFLVDAALDLLGSAKKPTFVCDVGTGSGCIALTLLHRLGRAHAVGVDVSEAALLVAKRNAVRLGVNKRLTLIAADCLRAFDRAKARFDLVISNPPYVAADALTGLQREVREHEPRVALTPGGDGLSIIRCILSDSPAFLVGRGYLIMEIGFDQRPAVEQMIDSRVWKTLDIRNDLQGIPRTVVLQLRSGQ